MLPNPVFDEAAAFFVTCAMLVELLDTFTFPASKRDAYEVLRGCVVDIHLRTDDGWVARVQEYKRVRGAELAERLKVLAVLNCSVSVADPTAAFWDEKVAAIAKTVTNDIEQ